jgi:hypothetical protein
VRISGGFGRRFANGDTWGGDPQRIPPRDVDSDSPYDGPEERVRELEPLDRTGQTSAPETLQRSPGVETRAPAHEVWYLIRAFGAWSADWTGQHGVIGLREADAGQAAGGMQPWDGARRTLRSQPLVPWDAGTALGPAQVA